MSLDEAEAVEARMYEDLLAIAERDDAEAIVVGAPHRAGAERVFGRDVAACTVHGAPVAVAVAPAGCAEHEPVLRTVGVGFDGSAESRAALRLGGQLARTAGAALRVISVTSATAPQHVAAAIAEGGTYEVVAGRPATELARRSADLDLLVVGSRALGPVRRLLLGSTSTQLVRETRCPVLVVPRPVASAVVDEGTQPSAAAR